MKKNSFPLVQKIISQLEAYKFDGAIITSSDPHSSLYPSDSFLMRKILIEFEGSAGTLLFYRQNKKICLGLFVDGRYHLEAKAQFANSGINIFCLGLPSVLEPIAFLKTRSKENKRIYVDGHTVSVSDFQKWERELAVSNILLSTHSKVDQIFSDIRGGVEEIKISPYIPVITRATGGCLKFQEDSFAYEALAMGAKNRIRNLKSTLGKQNLDAILISSLEQISFILSLRGHDINYNGLFYSYLFVSKKECRLFLHKETLSGEVANYCKEIGIKIDNYPTSFASLLPTSQKIKRLAIDFSSSSILLKNEISTLGIEVVEWEKIYNSIEREKSIRTTCELDYLQMALTVDGVALVKLYNHLQTHLMVQTHNTANTITEEEAADLIHSYRQEASAKLLGDNHYCGPSFKTISCSGETSAVVHYQPSSSRPILSDSPYLIDTGGLFLWATTDITRVFYFPSKRPIFRSRKNFLKTKNQDFLLLKKIYTLVVKGHILLATSEFPVGTTGAMLDSIARRYLWLNGYDYGHSTGHGVGAGLNVHQGPHSISSRSKVALEPNMILTNEPGCYLEGHFGIRFENMMQVVLSDKPGFLKFKTLSLCPLEVMLLDKKLLSKFEIDWINGYHKMVREKISFYLNREEKRHLKKWARPL